MAKAKTDPAGRVWLLAHPGRERVPPRGEAQCSWPSEQGPHRRKFMQLDGRGISKSGQITKSPMGVWLEYEAPSDATRVTPVGRGPRYIQTPSTTVGSPTLNTDPWVFHPGFAWSICRHRPSWQCPPRGECCSREGGGRCPQPGDIVLFGSSMNATDSQRDWVLDTVLVVERRLGQMNEPALRAPYPALVAPTLLHARPYLGRKYAADTAFSFSPCKPGGDAEDFTFERPSIRALLQELKRVRTGQRPSPASAMALTECQPDAGMDKFWNRLTKLVWAKGLLLGVQFELPRIVVSGAASVAPSSSCEPTGSPRKTVRRRPGSITSSASGC
jgi:hypothetical protein